MASAELQKRKREEYEMQLFGFHSRSVYAIISSVIERKIKSRCLHLYEAIDNKYKPDEKGKALLKQNVKELKKLYIERAKPHLENIQDIIEKYITIPDNVLLPEDKCQAVQYSDEQFEEMNEKLRNLQNRLKRAQVLSILLDKEKEASKEVEKFNDSLTGIFEVMEKASKYPQPDSEVIHAIERLQTLNNILETISPKTEKQIYNPTLEHVSLEEFDPTVND